MTLEVKLTAILKAISPSTFADFAPTSTQRPYITYQQVGGDVIPTLADIAPDKENAEMQISVWADSRRDAKAVITAVEAALIAAQDLSARPISAPVSDYDADMERYCSRQDFSIWADR
ncbi:hypothetical protein ASF61_16790 [Duganella sp. Leaf126]|uniref:tail completion protein gp17 n=1 Tax=Duganella sp. Leaf126 TaxID=1736266 RepID=UPI0006F3F9AF|nr:DUF3168 domain-containing protein [Duganella sp. Leaf126]KQQ31991.1 hypothetical protein ASF61_16790 [Duganella sp. Leaf126]